MDNQFVIKHQDGDIVRTVKSGKILFRRDGRTWKVGLEIKTFDEAAWEETGAGDCDGADWAQIHLIDYPLGEDDPRPKEQLEISVPEGFDLDNPKPYTNLYFGEHFQPNNNQIRIAKLQGDEYFVTWTCTGKDVDYYDSRAKDNDIAIACVAQVVDRICYPW